MASFPIDRSTKWLLFMIAAGLWAHLLALLFAPAPGVAQRLLQPVRIEAVRGTIPVAIVHQERPLEVKTPVGQPLEVKTPTGHSLLVELKAR